MLYRGKSSRNERVAKYILDGVCEITGFMNRGIREADIPWDILVKCGYITSPLDRERLQQHATKIKIVSGIVEGLKGYLSFWTTANDKI